MVHLVTDVSRLTPRIRCDVIPVEQFAEKSQAAGIQKTPTLLDPTTGQALVANVPMRHLVGWLYQTAWTAAMSDI
ncbi:MAG: hypothetical protein OWQ57_07095 [Sulfobacillus sp.]|nr:hypothetical protein [Sulfobacillus sp.]